MAANALRHHHAGRKSHDNARRSGGFFLSPMVAGLVIASVAAITHARAESIPAIIGSMVPLENVTDFRAQPLALLAKFPEAGPAMAHFVATLITREPQVADSVLSVIKDSSPQQASAIGAGLVRGARAMGINQSAVARNISAKVMQSDNLWLKTTFQALGTNYSGAAASLPPLLPPPVLATEDEGTPPPAQRTRLGKTKPDEPITNKPSQASNRNPSFSNRSELLNRDGMLVAIVASDAPSNGAVSTSPTQ